MTKTNEWESDATRYVVLRNLAAGMRHALMGELQAIQFAADLAAQMISKGVSGPPLIDAVNQIASQTGAAIVASRSVMEWLRPEDGALTEVEFAVSECVKLVGDVWLLRGIRATANCLPGCPRVAKATFYELFVASLLSLTDLHSGALDIDVTVAPVNGKVVVKLDARAADRRSAPPPEVGRAITLADVGMLADAHQVRCHCNDASITLEFQPASDFPGSRRDAEPATELPPSATER